MIYDEHFVVDEYGNVDSANYLKNVPVGYLQEKNYSASKIEAAVKATKWRIIRDKRTALLAETDWMANSDVTMSDEWKTYRQALRDITVSNADPDNVVFPNKPSG